MVPVQSWRQTLGSEELKTSWHQASIHLPLPYQDFSYQVQAPSLQGSNRRAARDFEAALKEGRRERACVQSVHAVRQCGEEEQKERAKEAAVSQERARKPSQQLQEGKGARRSQTGGEKRCYVFVDII